MGVQGGRWGGGASGWSAPLTRHQRAIGQFPHAVSQDAPQVQPPSMKRPITIDMSPITQLLIRLIASVASGPRWRADASRRRPTGRQMAIADPLKGNSSFQWRSLITLLFAVG